MLTYQNNNHTFNSELLKPFTSIISVLMCSDCMHITNTIVTNTNAPSIIKNNIEMLSVNTNYYGVCPHCHEDVKFEPIDINMARIIEMLNNKGYFTAFCCEGHIKYDYDGNAEISYPYIYFYLWDNYKILETHPLPNDWIMYNPKAEVFTIRVKHPEYFEDDSEYKKYLNKAKRTWFIDKEKYLKDIFEWANSLPDKPESKKEKDYKFIVQHKQAIIEMNATKTVLNQ